MPVKFLADENVPIVVIESLRTMGLDVEWVAELAPTIADEEVCQMSMSTGRVILTNDKDFGDLVMRRGLPTSGVVLLRLQGLTPNEVAIAAGRAFLEFRTWKGHFSVVTGDSLRMRPLPGR